MKRSSVLSIAIAPILLGSLLPLTALACGKPISQLPSSAPTQTDLKDMQIVPGQRFGPITRSTTYNTLVKLFGASKLKHQDVYGPEGIGRWDGTRVNLGPTKSFLVVWKDSQRSQVTRVETDGSAWTAPQGIRVGMSLTQLEQKIGVFEITGLGWDYGNRVLVKDPKLVNALKGLSIAVKTDPDAVSRNPKDYRAVAGEVTLPSSNPHWRSLGIQVGYLTVFFAQ